MTNIEAYFDESGTHAGSRFTVVGGAYGGNLRWNSVSVQWSAILKRFGVNIFHAKHLSNFGGEFSGWDEAKRSEFSSKLLDVIVRERLQIFVIALPNDSFKEVKCEFPDIRIDEYRFCCEQVLSRMICKVAGMKRVRTLSITYEGGIKLGTPLIQYYETVGAYVGQRQHPIRLIVQKKSKSEAIPLQTADLLAYEFYKHSIQDEESQRHNRRDSLLKLDPLIKQSSGGTVTSRETIREYFRIKREAVKQLASLGANKQ